MQIVLDVVFPRAEHLRTIFCPLLPEETREASQHFNHGFSEIYRLIQVQGCSSSESTNQNNFLTDVFSTLSKQCLRKSC